MNVVNLKSELQDLEGIIRQNPETGKITTTSFVSVYTNRVFGAPFQFMDSVDKRFGYVNPNVGNEYLRNFLLNAPILHIRPGMPKYTGGDDGDNLLDMIKKLYFANSTSELGAVDSLLQMLAKSTVFGAGHRLQRRMFGFRETYYDYMQYVNYMCRSCAVYLYLTDGVRFPDGAFYSKGSEWHSFSDFEWQYYRMLSNSNVKSPTEYLSDLIGHSADPIIKPMISIFGTDTSTQISNWLSSRMGLDSSDVLSVFDIEYQLDFINNEQYGGVASQIGNKVTTLDIMVEPGQVQETITNTTGTSMVEQGIDAIRDSVGSEIGWITNSHADTGAIGDLMGFLGSGIETVTTKISDLGESVTGGFVGGLFTGAVSSVRGQKMIYPEIYKSSTSTMDNQFTVTLTTPYGDIYNYYMNILVPLMHLIALAAPRMVTSNTVSSPFIVQAWIPGNYTCQLGIVENMSITKNPNGNKVSVNGFPLEVQVTFKIKELYNALSISPSNDPASFLFNETLNDYLANLSGMIPSVDTYTKQREATFNALANYIKDGGIFDDLANLAAEKYEDWANPFAGR